MLLPPKQFRDAPSPVTKIHGEEAGAVDNILYHIYESPRRETVTHRFTSQLKRDTNTPSIQGFCFCIFAKSTIA